MSRSDRKIIRMKTSENYEYHVYDTDLVEFRVKGAPDRDVIFQFTEIARKRYKGRLYINVFLELLEATKASIEEATREPFTIRIKKSIYFSNSENVLHVDNILDSTLDDYRKFLGIISYLSNIKILSRLTSEDLIGRLSNMKNASEYPLVRERGVEYYLTPWVIPLDPCNILRGSAAFGNVVATENNTAEQQYNFNCLPLALAYTLNSNRPFHVAFVEFYREKKIREYFEYDNSLDKLLLNQLNETRKIVQDFDKGLTGVDNMLYALFSKSFTKEYSDFLKPEFFKKLEEQRTETIDFLLSKETKDMYSYFDQIGYNALHKKITFIYGDKAEKAFTLISEKVHFTVMSKIAFMHYCINVDFEVEQSIEFGRFFKENAFYNSVYGNNIKDSINWRETINKLTQENLRGLPLNMGFDLTKTIKEGAKNAGD